MTFFSSGILDAGSPVSYCVFPGNKNSGYCLLKEKNFTSFFSERYLNNMELYWAIHPLIGYAVPIITIFIDIRLII